MSYRSGFRSGSFCICMFSITKYNMYVYVNKSDMLHFFLNMYTIQVSYNYSWHSLSALLNRLRFVSLEDYTGFYGDIYVRLR